MQGHFTNYKEETLEITKAKTNVSEEFLPKLEHIAVENSKTDHRRKTII